jgi:hypothetical protein
MYWVEPVPLESDGRSIYPRVEALSALQNLMSCLEIEARDPSRAGRAGRPLEPPLEAVATAHCPEPGATRLEDLPITFRFVRGEGDILGDVFTEREGIARARVARLSAGSEPQLVVAELDPLRWISSDSVSTVVRRTLENTARPSARFVIDVSGASIRLESSESNLSRPMAMSRIGSRIEAELLRDGVEFTDDSANAEYVLTIRADTRAVSDYEGLYTARADVEVTMLDLTTDQEVFRQTIQGAKGVQTSYERAGIAAYATAEERLVEEVLPEIRALVR